LRYRYRDEGFLYLRFGAERKETASAMCLSTPIWEQNTCLTTPPWSIVGDPAREQTQVVGNTVEPSDLLCPIAEQGEGQLVLICETLVRFHGIRTYPHDLGIQLFESLVFVPEGARFLGTAGGVILGVENKTTGFSPRKSPRLTISPD
jgi:hypothetical protein